MQVVIGLVNLFGQSSDDRVIGLGFNKERPELASQMVGGGRFLEDDVDDVIAVKVSRSTQKGFVPVVVPVPISFTLQSVL